MPRGTIYFAFLLMALLIFGAYAVGLVSDANSIFAGLTRLGNMVTGRNAAGQFAGYPANAPAVVQPPSY